MPGPAINAVNSSRFLNFDGLACCSMVVASSVMGCFNRIRVRNQSSGERIASLIRILALRFTAFVGAPLKFSREYGFGTI